jgi:hypothetical protein
MGDIWVQSFNAKGSDGLLNGKTPGARLHVAIPLR